MSSKKISLNSPLLPVDGVTESGHNLESKVNRSPKSARKIAAVVVAGTPLPTSGMATTTPDRSICHRD